VDYSEALTLAHAGKAVLFGNNGGWKRYLHFTMREVARDTPVVVDVRLFSTVIANIIPSGVTLHDGGYIQRQTTRDAMNYVLPSGRAMWRQNWRVYVAQGWQTFTADSSTEYHDGMFVPADMSRTIIRTRRK
jgi:hypothetical protein